MHTFCSGSVRTSFAIAPKQLTLWYPRNISPIVLTLFPTYLLRLSILNVFYTKNRLKHLGNELQLPHLHDTGKIKDYEPSM